jgi:hypothetical protein
VRTVAWHPWAELRRREHLVFALEALPEATGGAVYAQRGPRAAIVIDPTLGRRQRKAALAHELVHDERGGGCEYEGMLPAWHPVVSRDENRVHDEVARRLVPLEELRAFCGHQAEVNDSVAAWQVAEYFDVPDAVGARALQLLAERNQICIDGRHRSQEDSSGHCGGGSRS